MYSIRIAVFCIVGLCATQLVHGGSLEDLPSDIINKIQDAIHKLQDSMEQLKNEVEDEIKQIEKNIQNLPKCMESQKPQVTELMNKAEQQLREGETKMMSIAEPVMQKGNEIMKDATPVIRTAMEGIMKCEAESSNTMIESLCMARVLIPLSGDIKKITDEVQTIIPLIENAYNQIQPLIPQYRSEIENDIAQAEKILNDTTNCVVNGNQS